MYINMKTVLSAQSVILSHSSDCVKGAVLTVCLPTFQTITGIYSNQEQNEASLWFVCLFVCLLGGRKQD